jgi:hypothetical protein
MMKALLFLLAVTVSGQTSTLAVNPAASNVNVGEEFTVQIVFLPNGGEKAPVLGCSDAAVGYDPKALQLLSLRFPQSEAPLDDSERRPAVLTSVQANNSGHVRFQRVSLGDSAIERKLAAGGPVVVATIAFRARAAGSHALLLNATTLCDESSNPLLSRIVSGFVNVAAPSQ